MPEALSQGDPPLPLLPGDRELLQMQLRPGPRPQEIIVPGAGDATEEQGGLRASPGRPQE